MIILWVAKEAASKAYGTGLRGEMKNWHITKYDIDNQQITVNYSDKFFTCQIFNFATEIVAICQDKT